MPPRRALRRSISAVAAGLVLAALPSSALGHVELVTSSPLAGENLATAPTEVTITFDAELDPAGSGFTVNDQLGEQVGSGEVDLDMADRNVLAGPVSISEPGVYTVVWEVLGADGHEISGSFSFGFATDETSPDTALAASTTSPMTAAGLLLLELAALAALRRVVVR